MDPSSLFPDEPTGGATLEFGLERELPGLRAYVARLVGRAGAHGAEAEDLAQEVLARALRYRASFDLGRPLGPWLRRAALRVFLDHREREQRAPHATEGLPEDYATSRPDSSEEFAQQEELSLLLKRLAPLERDVLERFHRLGDSVREIARALKLPAGTVKSHLHRARRKLATLRPREDEL